MAASARSGDALSLRQVTRQFGPTTPPAVQSVDMSVAPGDFVAIMGRSGSGKSTLLRCAAGLDVPTSGSVTWRGRDLARLSASSRAELRRSDFTVMHQDYNLLPALTAGENVELPLRLAGRRLRSGQVEQALTAVGLAGASRRRPAQLSGGEQQRVALARAVAAQASVLFADEPTGALDSTSRDAVLDLLASLVSTGQRSLVMVTHDPWVAARAHRVLFMQDGCVVAHRDHPTLPQVLAVIDALAHGRAAAGTDRVPGDAASEPARDQPAP